MISRPNQIASRDEGADIFFQAELHRADAINASVLPMLPAAVAIAATPVAVCDEAFTVRFLNTAMQARVDRIQPRDDRSALSAAIILEALGVGDPATCADIVNEVSGVAGFRRERVRETRLHGTGIEVERFVEQCGAVGWLFTARLPDALPVRSRRTDRDVIALSDRLSPRECEVVLGLEEGCSNKVIALRLNISPRTVEYHRARIMQRFGATSVVALIRTIIADGSYEGSL